MEIKYGKQVNFSKLKINAHKKKDSMTYKKYCQELISESNLIETNYFVCNSNDNKYLFSIYGFDYVQCNHCSHVYVHKLPDLNEVKEVYTSELNENMTQKLYANENVYQYRIEK